MVSISELHIMLFTGRHPVLSFFIEQFVVYLDSCGIDYYLVNADDPSTYNGPAFEKYIMQDNVVAFMFNNIGVGMLSSDGTNLWKKMDIPVFNWLVDHPRNFEDPLRDPQCDIYVFAPDRDHVSFMERHYPKLKGYFFAPNGGGNLGTPIPYKERTIDVLYMGDCQEKNNYFPNVSFLPENGEDYYNYAISLLVKNPEISTDEAIEQYLINAGISLNDDQIFKLASATAAYIERFVRRLTKMEGMKALSDAGINVEVYGLQWICDDYPFSENIRIHDRIDVHELLKKTCNAKICLCFIPWFKKGCSEKNFDAMINGSICITDRSSYLNQNYVDGYNIVYFDLNNPLQMAEDVKWLLANPDSAEIIAKRGYETASKYDSWNNRFDLIVEKMCMILNTKG